MKKYFQINFFLIKKRNKDTSNENMEFKNCVIYIEHKRFYGFYTSLWNDTSIKSNESKIINGKNQGFSKGWYRTGIMAHENLEINNKTVKSLTWYGNGELVKPKTFKSFHRRKLLKVLNELKNKLRHKTCRT